ncbi:PREDICTED: T-cell surface antigen CD2 [Miniopterus natalensis]|uniref:T-cell surface antigen CD2 n=1 Tax=Miniopterus natalensis TaxID=291302 RepID=UPI0007A6AE46|nr:PREDICTED: T-cell surface antigen CD2 [Miniopterus natalensis]
MNIACKTLVASFLLMFTLSAKGAAATTKEVHGTLHLDINLDVPTVSVKGKIDDIQWKKGDDRIIRFTESKITHQTKATYQVFENATLKIKRLQMNDSGYYTVFLYDVNGKQILSNTFNLKVLERVSKPVIYWSCTNTTVTCEVTEGTDPQLTLYRNRNKIKEGPKVIVYQWTTKLNALFNCTATNKVSKDSNEVNIRCPEKELDIYLIIGICGGGVLFLLFVALLILFISKRKKQHRRKNDEELEIRAHRTISEERSRRPQQIPASATQNPVMSQAPPPPGHRPQAHGHRPPPPGHRAHHQQQKRPLPSPGTQLHQQKGPPLPRPRVQPKLPRGATENS